ncbi:MAG: MFS transporter [Candidatus Bathyarchaeota archaeon]
MGEGNEDIRNVYMLGFVSFFTDVSSEMVFSILPVFILGLPGGSVATLGFIEGVAEALSYMLRAVSGVFSDKFRRRKPFIILGYALSNVVKPFFAAASTVTDALIIRVADRVGKGIRTAPRDALISDSVPAGRRGEAFGLHRTLDQTGAIVGPLVATAVMVFLGWTVREVFWLSLVPGTIALVIILFGVKEIVGDELREFRFLQGLREVARGRFLVLLGIVAMFSLGAFNFSFILLNAKEMGVGDALIPVVYAVVNVAHTLVAIPAGRLADRVGKEKVLSYGYLVFLASVALLALSPRLVVSAYVAAAVFGAYVGVVETVQRALVPGYVEAGLRGTAYGLYYLVVGTAFLVANSVVGALWQTQGLWVSSLYSGALAAAAFIGLTVFNRR